ncbi:hypothetical protein GGD66_006601 [Bradyrhizobium sp. CIR48]|uniref:hypothetical protein n=1 Tax=Bradyrhizobium sp. CIR48 TaxID=2663840 RepID=UPI0016063549|nr:hypothetical protein [Bradyrhizobium sp. CIR48]MBB4428015.1 hypothetical protein [Bradyrhizobium sp. CIR48]
MSRLARRLSTAIAVFLALTILPALAQVNPGTSPLSVPKGGTGASSFTSNLPVIGGAGTLSQGTRSGSTTQFVTGTSPFTASGCVSFDGNGNLTTVAGACQTGSYTAPNTSPAAQTIQSKLRDIGLVTCEDFATTCGSSDDTTAVQAAINYAASSGRCFQFNRTFIVTTILVADKAHLCLTGKGGLFGKTGTTASAVLEIRNTIGTTIDGNITLNCNSQTGYTSGLKVWSNGLATAQFNPRISLSAIANCKLAAQYGDTVQPDNTFSENILKVGYTYNVAQGVKVVGVQAVLVMTDRIIIVDPRRIGLARPGTASTALAPRSR